MQFDQGFSKVKIDSRIAINPHHTFDYTPTKIPNHIDWSDKLIPEISVTHPITIWQAHMQPWNVQLVQLKI